MYVPLFWTLVCNMTDVHLESFDYSFLFYFESSTYSDVRSWNFRLSPDERCLCFKYF